MVEAQLLVVHNQIHSAIRVTSPSTFDSAHPFSTPTTGYINHQ